MTIRPMFDMMEATRLTREGRLTEAMAVLRGSRPEAHATTTARSSDSDVGAHEANARGSALVDMIPPSIPEALGRCRPSARASPLLNATT